MKKLFPFLHPYKKQLILGPFFKLLEAIFELALPLYLAKLIDRGLIHHNIHAIWQNSLTIIILSLIGLGCVFICQYYASIASQGFGTKLREACMRHILNLDATTLSHISNNTLLTRMTSDINQMQQAVAMFIRLVIRAPFLSIGSIIMAFTIDKIFGFLFLFILLCFILLLTFIMKKTVPIYEETQQTTDKLNQIIIDNLTGQEIIRTFNQTKPMLEYFQKKNHQYTKTAVKAGNIASLLQPGTVFMINISLSILFLISCPLLVKKQVLAGQLVALITYMNQMLLALIVIANLVTLFTRAFASTNRIITLLNADTPKKIVIQQAFGNLTLNHIDYRYSPNQSFVLRDISCDLTKGQTLGITGPTGSGKSTLLKIIEGILIPTNGKIIPSLSTSDSAITTQKPMLFTGTIRDNLLWGNPRASDEEMWHALEMAHISEEIKKLPNLLDTPITQGGSNFSGGQKQRLSLARALIKNPNYLILDDTFSALDAKTCMIIYNNLQKFYPDTTKIIVTQQLAILKQIDHIMILNKGKIEGLGNHQQLKETSTLYQLLIKQQEEAKNEN